MLDEHGVGPVDGILADIGVSSYQLDQAHRGFSFRESGPVDMRMNQGEGETAEEMIRRLSVGELAGILRTFGEEPFAGPISRAINQWVDGAAPLTTASLASAVADAIPMKVRKKRNHHPATRTFQALRIAVNDELGALEKLLDSVPDCLTPGGRVLIITFHSLEDRMVKRRFNAWAAKPATGAPGHLSRLAGARIQPTVDRFPLMMMNVHAIPVLAVPASCSSATGGCMDSSYYPRDHWSNRSHCGEHYSRAQPWRDARIQDRCSRKEGQVARGGIAPTQNR